MRKVPPGIVGNVGRATRLGIAFTATIAAGPVFAGDDLGAPSSPAALVGCWGRKPNPDAYEKLCFEGNGDLFATTFERRYPGDPWHAWRRYTTAGDGVTMGWPSADEPTHCRYAVEGITMLRLDACRIAGTWTRERDE